MNGSAWSRLKGRPALRVSKNAVARLSAQVWAKLLSMALVALVARYASAAGLGRYVLVLTLVGMAGAASDLGLNTFLTREAARATDRARQRDLLGLVLPLKVCLSVAGIAGLAAIATAAPFPPETKRLIPLGSLVLVPDAAAGAMRAFINARQRMEVSGLLDMVVKLIAVAGALPALATGLGVAGVLGCTAIASGIGVLLYSAVLRRWHSGPDWRWDPGAWRVCLAESYPFALTSIIAVAYTRMDLVLLGLWQGEVTAGWYAAAYKLWETVGLLPASLLDAMFPEISRLGGSQEGIGRLRGLFRTGGWAMLVGGVLLAAGGTAGANVLIPVIYGTGERYAPTVVTFRLLVWAIPAMFLYLLGGHTLYALGKQRQVTVAMLVVGLANVGLNVLVIPRWSYMGAASVALASEWLLWGLLYPRARQTLTRSQVPASQPSSQEA